MQTFTILASLGLASLGAAQSNFTSSRPASVTSSAPSFIPSKPANVSSSAYTTITTVVDYFVTYCAEPTTFYINDDCYTATADQYVTVTDCGCTVESVCYTPYTYQTPAPGTTLYVTGNLVSAAANTPSAPKTAVSTAGAVGATGAASAATGAATGAASAASVAAAGSTPATKSGSSAQGSSPAASSTPYVTVSGGAKLATFLGGLATLPLLVAVML